jgi:hypothetical protein
LVAVLYVGLDCENLCFSLGDLNEVFLVLNQIEDDILSHEFIYIRLASDFGNLIDFSIFGTTKKPVLTLKLHIFKHFKDRLSGFQFKTNAVFRYRF